MVVRARRGQGTVEYMLYVSVMIIALALVGYAFIGSGFSSGFQQMTNDAQTVFQRGMQNGSGDMR